MLVKFELIFWIITLFGNLAMLVTVGTLIVWRIQDVIEHRG